MNAEATTHAEYIAAFGAMRNHPIIGDHQIGKVKASVGVKRWTVTDDHGNKWSGPVKTGPAVRHKVNIALHEWLGKSGIR